MSLAARRATSLGVVVRGVAVVEHQVVAVWVGEERHVADAGVHDLAGQDDAFGLELRPGRGDVVHVKGRVSVLLWRELHTELRRLPDAEAGLPSPELEPPKPL